MDYMCKINSFTMVCEGGIERYALNPLWAMKPPAKVGGFLLDVAAM